MKLSLKISLHLKRVSTLLLHPRPTSNLSSARLSAHVCVCVCVCVCVFYDVDE